MQRAAVVHVNLVTGELVVRNLGEELHPIRVMFELVEAVAG